MPEIEFKENGRTPEEGFDCVGYVLWEVSRQGYKVSPRLSIFGDARLQNQAILSALAEECDKIDNPEPGCIVTFWLDVPNETNHMGIVIDRTHFRHISRKFNQLTTDRLARFKHHITGFYRVRDGKHTR